MVVQVLFISFKYILLLNIINSTQYSIYKNKYAVFENRQLLTLSASKLK